MAGEYGTDPVDPTGTVQPASSGGGGGTYTLGTGRQVGDVFYRPASIHGHVGIYYLTGTIVEAPGGCCTVTAKSAYSYKVPSGSTKMQIETSQNTRTSAAVWANNRQGTAYNYSFFNNKKTTGKMNCSQLVWAAYKVYSVNLDSNGGFGVYPKDIIWSVFATRYKRF